MVRFFSKTVLFQVSDDKEGAIIDHFWLVKDKIYAEFVKISTED